MGGDLVVMTRPLIGLLFQWIGVRMLRDGVQDRSQGIQTYQQQELRSQPSCFGPCLVWELAWVDIMKETVSC